mmetsp:Transcript_10783/g.24170  ORF Transcript_10783/g.24170 Transcript_10783/m.24170 type:complete len:265 (+) Transcript_10783:1174-1968(+)
MIHVGRLFGQEGNGGILVLHRLFVQSRSASLFEGLPFAAPNASFFGRSALLATGAVALVAGIGISAAPLNHAECGIQRAPSIDARTNRHVRLLMGLLIILIHGLIDGQGCRCCGCRRRRGWRPVPIAIVLLAVGVAIIIIVVVITIIIFLGIGFVTVTGRCRRRRAVGRRRRRRRFGTGLGRSNGKSTKFALDGGGGLGNAVVVLWGGIEIGVAILLDQFRSLLAFVGKTERRRCFLLLLERRCRACWFGFFDLFLLLFLGKQG